MLLGLVRVRWRSVVNQFTRSPAGQRAGARMTLLWSGVFALAIGWVSYRTFQVLFDLATEQRLHLLPFRLPALVLMWAFWMLVFSGMSVAIQHFYVQRDVSLLLVAPVRPALALGAKLADIALVNVGFFVLTGGPALVAYALAREYITLEYMFRSAVAMLGFSVPATMLGTVAALLIMRILPAHRLREILGALGLLAVSLVYVGFNVLIHRLQDPDRALQGLSTVRSSLTSPTLTRGPWAWAGDVVAMPSGYPEAYSALSLTVLAAVISFLICLAIAERVHMEGWLSAQEVGSPMRGHGALGCRAEAALSWLAGPVRAFVLKDLRTLARDMRQLSMLLLPAAVVVVLILNIRVVPEARSVPPAFVSLSLLPVIAMIAVRVATSALVGESRALWVALVAPGARMSIVAGKLLYTAMLTFPLALAATASFAVLFGMSGAEWVVVVVATLVTNIALSAISVGVTARYMDLTGGDAGISVPTTSRLFALALQLAYSAVVSACAVFAWGLVTVAHWPSAILYPIAVVTALAVSGLATVSPIAAAARRLAQMEL